GDRREAVGRAGSVRDDVVLVGVVLVFVDAQDERDVLALGRRRDDHLLGARLDVLAGALGVAEDAGRLDDDLHAQVAPWQLLGVALLEGLEATAVDRDRIAVGLNVGVVNAVGRVVLQQVRQDRIVIQVIDRDDLQIVLVGLGDGLEDLPPDAAKAVDRYTRGHSSFPSCLSFADYRVAGLTSPGA